MSHKKRKFTEWWNMIPIEIKEKSKTTHDKSITNQINYILMNSKKLKYYNLPTFDELEYWIVTRQIKN